VDGTAEEHLRIGALEDAGDAGAPLELLLEFFFTQSCSGEFCFSTPFGTPFSGERPAYVCARVCASCCILTPQPTVRAFQSISI